MSDSHVILFDFIHGLVGSFDGTERPQPAASSSSPSSCVVRLNALVREAERQG